jgi:outer membrane protein assembly factor BamA
VPLIHIYSAGQIPIFAQIAALTKGIYTTLFFLLLVGIQFPLHANELIPPHDIADSATYIHIRNIEISGYKTTKPFVIERELTIRPDSRIHADSLIQVIEQNRLNIFNLKIFNGVAYNIRNWVNDTLDLEFIVFERWTIFPVPIFRLADRNFNVWWNEFDHKFNRVQYGGMLIWDNFRGRNERLRITNTYGFYQTLDLDYYVPRLKRYGKVGAHFHGSFFQSKKYGYTTIDDTEEFLYPEEFVIRNTDIGARYSFTLSTRTQHYLESYYGFTWIADTMAMANPDFLLDGSTTQHRLSLGYEFVKDYRDLKAYPLDGWYFSASFRSHILFGENKTSNYSVVQSRFSRYVKLHPKHYTAHLVKVQISAPDIQPYYNQKAMGYEEDYIRGYENYLIDGQHFLLSRNAYKFKLLDIKLSNIKFLQRTPLGTIPLMVMLNFHFDAGYVWDKFYTETNSLRNQLLVGFGAGIDIVTFGEGVLRFEYSFNKQLENGLYLHVKLPI